MNALSASHPNPPSRKQLLRIGLLYLISALTLLSLFIYLFDVVLLLFGAALLAVLLRWPTDWLRDRLGIRDGFAFGGVIIGALLLLSALSWLVGDALTTQFNQLADQVPERITDLRERAGKSSALRPLLERASAEQQSMRLLGRGLDVITATFGAIINLVLVLFMAVLLAAQPKLYVEGSLHLLPVRRRERIHEVIQEAGWTLQRWMLGQLTLMSLVGGLTYIGLWLLEVPMAGALALLAGLLTFVPFIGPFVAGAIGVLVALAQGIDLALYVAALYVGVQIIEGACEPLVHQKAVYLPPVLLLLAQLILGVLAGAIGIILATPLAAVGIVAVKRLYVEDMLQDHSLSEAKGVASNEAAADT